MFDMSIQFIALFSEHNVYNIGLHIYTTAKKKRPNQLGYLVGIWL